jgi:hypothetical protein
LSSLAALWNREAPKISPLSAATGWLVSRLARNTRALFLLVGFWWTRCDRGSQLLLERVPFSRKYAINNRCVFLENLDRAPLPKKLENPSKLLFFRNSKKKRFLFVKKK